MRSMDTKMRHSCNYWQGQPPHSTSYTGMTSSLFGDVLYRIRFQLLFRLKPIFPTINLTMSSASMRLICNLNALSMSKKDATLLLSFVIYNLCNYLYGQQKDAIPKVV